MTPAAIAFLKHGRADLLVGLDAPQRVPTGFMVPMRELGIEEALHELEDTRVRSHRREEADNVDARSIRLLTSAATIIGVAIDRLRALAGRFPGAAIAGSADFQSAVSPICNRRTVPMQNLFGFLRRLQVENLRYSRLQMCATLMAALLAAGCGSGPATALDLAGHPVDPLQATNAKAVLLLFVSSTCPICNRYAPEFRRLHERFAPRGVTIWRVYPDADDTAIVIEEHQREFSLPGNALRDPAHALVNLAGARVTPEAALFLPGGKRVYLGRIDDWYTDFGKSRPEPTRRDLQEAIEAMLAGRSVSNATTTAIGCHIPKR